MTQLVITLVRADNGNWSWSAGDTDRRVPARQGAGAWTAEQALKEALHMAGYKTLEDRTLGEA